MCVWFKFIVSTRCQLFSISDFLRRHVTVQIIFTPFPLRWNVAHPPEAVIYVTDSFLTYFSFSCQPELERLHDHYTLNRTSNLRKTLLEYPQILLNSSIFLDVNNRRDDLHFYYFLQHHVIVRRIDALKRSLSLYSPRKHWKLLLLFNSK